MSYYELKQIAPPRLRFTLRPADDGTAMFMDENSGFTILNLQSDGSYADNDGTNGIRVEFTSKYRATVTRGRDRFVCTCEEKS